MRKFFRKLFNQDSVSVFGDAFFNLMKNIFPAFFLILMSGSAGALVGLPITIALAALGATYEIASIILKVLISISSIFGIFMVIESKTGTEGKHNKDLCVEVAIATWIGCLYWLWFIE